MARQEVASQCIGGLCDVAGTEQVERRRHEGQVSHWSLGMSERRLDLELEVGHQLHSSNYGISSCCPFYQCRLVQCPLSLLNKQSEHAAAWAEFGSSDDLRRSGASNSLVSLPLDALDELPELELETITPFTSLRLRFFSLSFFFRSFFLPLFFFFRSPPSDGAPPPGDPPALERSEIARFNSSTNS